MKKSIAIVAVIFSVIGVICISIALYAQIQIGSAHQELQHNFIEKDRYMNEYINETLSEIPEFPDESLQETDRDSLLLKADQAHKAYLKSEKEVKNWSWWRNIYFATGIPFMMIGLILFITGKGRQKSQTSSI